MQHFYEGIDGWFDFGSLYEEVIKHISDDSHIVEVGSYKGRSTAFMAVTIANSGKNIKFDCVDTWLGSPVQQKGGIIECEFAVSDTLYDHFIENMKPAEGYYNPIRLSSIEAAKLYEDESLYFVFIDADHEYESVLEDIKAWLPKLRKGCVMSGHDIHYLPVRQAVEELLPGWRHDKDTNTWNFVVS
jgi:predicted O-methyltransferase YrrM